MFGDNFVRASRGVLIDPVLGIAMHSGRLDLGTSAQAVQLLYDPDIRRHRLTMPPTPAMQRARPLFTLNFAVSRPRGVLELRLGTAADHLPTVYQLLREFGPPDVARDPSGFVEYVLSNVLRLETWDEWANSPDASRVALLIRRDVDRALAGAQPADGDPAEYVVIHSRDLIGLGSQSGRRITGQPLERRLATAGGRHELDREMAAKLRAGHFDDVDAFLREQIGRLQSKIADAVRASTADAVRIAGWEFVHRECARRLAAGVSIGAIGVNVSNYNDSSTSVWHDKEPAIEFAIYGNDAFDFSSATTEEILSASAAPPTPWQGQMMPIEPAVVPTISGLRLLNSALLEYYNEEPWRPSRSDDANGAAPEAYVAFALGEWMLHLRFHHAVARDMRQVGLPLIVPVLIGTHDVGPFIVSVVMPEKAPRLTPASVDEPRPLPNESQPAKSIADEHVSELDAMRRTIQSLGFFSRARRHLMIEQSEARESQLLQSVGLVWPRRTWEMSDSQFAAFAYVFRIAGEVSRDTTEPRGGADQPVSHDVAGRRQRGREINGVSEHEPHISGEDLHRVAYDVAERHRRGDLTREAALAELARRCPGFQNSEYERAFIRGLVESR